MNQISNAAKADRGASDVDAIFISEKAKQQIGSQASVSGAKLQGPAFFETLQGPAFMEIP